MNCSSSLLPILSQQPEKSGRNPKWVGDLTDISGKECRDFLAEIAEMPLLECNASDACDNTAQWAVTFHGCTWFVTCDVHRHLWSGGIEQAIESNGYIICEVCAVHLFTLAATMQWRAI